jgi:hypothetical protein
MKTNPINQHFSRLGMCYILFMIGYVLYSLHDPHKVISTHYHSWKYRWSYESEVWEVEEIHRRVRTYKYVNFKRQRISHHKGRVQDEHKSRDAEEERKRKIEEENKLKVEDK